MCVCVPVRVCVCGVYVCVCMCLCVCARMCRWGVTPWFFEVTRFWVSWLPGIPPFLVDTPLFLTLHGRGTYPWVSENCSLLSLRVVPLLSRDKHGCWLSFSSNPEILWTSSAFIFVCCLFSSFSGDLRCFLFPRLQVRISLLVSLDPASVKLMLLRVGWVVFITASFLL